MQDESTDKTKRQPTRFRGISYRVGADGQRTYSIRWKNGYVSKDAAGNLLTREGDALERQAELKGSSRKGERPVLATRVTFKEIAEEWLAGKSRHLRPRTATYYRNALDNVLLPRFGASLISAVGPDEVTRLIRDLESEGLHAIDHSRPKRGLGQSSIENYLKPLHGVMALAVRRRLIVTNPFSVMVSDDRAKRETREQPHEWSEDDVAKLLSASRKLAAKKESRYDYSLLLWVAAALGLRMSECLGLRWQDLDSTNGILHVRQQWVRPAGDEPAQYMPPKTEAGVRDIPIPNGPTGLKQALLEHKLASPFKGDEDPIFASRSGGPLQHRNATRRGFEAARDEAGLPEQLTFHDLRHAAASRLIAAGLDPVTVARFLGHKDASVTLKVYAHYFNRDQRDEQIRKALEGGAG